MGSTIASTGSGEFGRLRARGRSLSLIGGSGLLLDPATPRSGDVRDVDTEIEEAELEFEDLHEPSLTSPPRRRRLQTLRPPRWVGRTLLMYLASRLLVGLAVLMAI